MSATTTAIFVTAKKSLTWSIVLSALMILAGILAIFIPPVAGLAVTIFIGWIFSGVVGNVFALLPVTCTAMHPRFASAN